MISLIFAGKAPSAITAASKARNASIALGASWPILRIFERFFMSYTASLLGKVAEQPVYVTGRVQTLANGQQRRGAVGRGGECVKLHADVGQQAGTPDRKSLFHC